MSPQFFLKFLQVSFRGSGVCSIYINSSCMPIAIGARLQIEQAPRNIYLAVINSLRYVSER